MVELRSPKPSVACSSRVSPAKTLLQDSVTVFFFLWEIDFPASDVGKASTLHYNKEQQRKKQAGQKEGERNKHSGKKKVKKRFTLQ